MSIKESYDIALAIANIAMRNLQFFIMISIAFGGWIFAGDDIRNFGKFAPERFLIAIIFTIPTVGLLVGTVEALVRLNAVFDVSKEFFEKETESLNNAAKKMYAHMDVKRAAFFMGATVVFINSLILFFENP